MRPASVPLTGLRALGLAAGVLMLGACSTMEKLDPTTWFEEPPSTKVSTPAKPRPGAEGVPGQGQAFPNLGSVPGQGPKPQTTADERVKIADALVADTQGVQYAEKVAKPEQAAIAPPSPRPQKTEAGTAKSSGTAGASAGQAEPAPAAAPKPAQPSSQVAAQPPTALAPVTPPPSAAAPSTPAPVTPSTPASPAPSKAAAPGPPAPQPVGPPVAVTPPSPAPVARAPAVEPTGPIPQPPAPPEGVVPTTTIAGTGAPAPPRQRSASAKDVRSLDQFNRSRVAVSAEVGTISFAGGESDLRAADLTVLRELASAHRARGGLVRVVGYARGPASAERAMQVAHALVERGVPASKIYAGEMVGSDPAYKEARSELVPDNRRVEIFFDY